MSAATSENLRLLADWLETLTDGSPDANVRMATEDLRELADKLDGEVLLDSFPLWKRRGK
jgi:hypothetical protein